MSQDIRRDRSFRRRHLTSGSVGLRPGSCGASGYQISFPSSRARDLHPVQSQLSCSQSPGRSFRVSAPPATVTGAIHSVLGNQKLCQQDVKKQDLWESLRKRSPASGWCHPGPRTLPGAKLASPPPLPSASLCRPAHSASLEQEGHVRASQLAVPSTRTGGGDWHRPGQASSLASLHEDHGEKVAQCTVAQSVSPGTWLHSRAQRVGRADFLLLSQRSTSGHPPISPQVLRAGRFLQGPCVARSTSLRPGDDRAGDGERARG